MKATQIFGTHLLPMMEYVSWIQTKEAIEVLWPTFDNPFSALRKAHKFLSQPMDVSLFVRGDKPSKDDFTEEIHHHNGSIERRLLLTDYEEELYQFRTWKPLLKGDWTVIRGLVHYKVYGEYRPVVGEDSSICQSINDFASYCHKKGIKLELNEDFEI